MSIDGLDDLDEDSSSSGSSDTTSTDGEKPLYDQIEEITDGPDLIEIFGGSGSGKSVFSTQILNSAINDKGLDALFIDAERNVGDMGDISGSDYVYLPEWHDLYDYITGNSVDSSAFGENTTNSNVLEPGYDMIVFDSIGFPALVQYADYRVSDNADQFKVFLELQHITGKLKQYSQRSECMVIVTNQPKSDLSGETDPKPFGDKSIFGMKEVWKTEIESTNAVKTTCNINSYRSRQAGRGKKLFTVEISDSGVDVTNRMSEDPSEEWSV